MLTPLIKMVKKLILSRVFLYNQHLNLELSHCIESSASITAVILNDYSTVGVEKKAMIQNVGVICI